MRRPRDQGSIAFGGVSMVACCISGRDASGIDSLPTLRRLGVSDQPQGQLFTAAAPLECSWVMNDAWLPHHRLELENDLIASHLLVTGEIPVAQFQGSPRKEASCLPV